MSPAVTLSAETNLKSFSPTVAAGTARAARMPPSVIDTAAVTAIARLDILTTPSLSSPRPRRCDGVPPAARPSGTPAS